MLQVKKIFLILFLVSFVFLFGNTQIAFAGTSATDATGKSTFNVENSKKDLIYGMNYEKVSGTSVTGTNTENESVNVFSMKTDGIGSKLVTWYIQDNNDSFKRGSLVKIAEDYEKNHPGWIVVGGINSDQYYYNYGGQRNVNCSAYMAQPFYSMVVDSEKRFTTSVYGGANNSIGILNNGSTDGFIESTVAGDYVVETIDENNEIIQSFVVDGINEQASSGGTTVWSVYNNQYTTKGIVSVSPSTTEGKLFIVGDAEVAYMSDSTTYKYYNKSGQLEGMGQNAFFGRGAITSIDTSAQLNAERMFAVETSNEELLHALAIGKRIRVEHLFANDEMNHVESATGYHTAHILDGVDQKSSAEYNTKRYSRSLFGQTKDGTYYLLTADLATVDGVQCRGMNFEETNALGHYYGLYDMYQDDGGGSVTAVARNADGKLQIVNVPKDSGDPNVPREVLAGLFFVVRDPGVAVKESDHQSITFEKTAVSGTAKINNISVTINDTTKEFTNDTLTFSGLMDQQTYEVSIDYDIIIGEVTTREHFSILASTKSFDFPDLQVSVTNRNTHSITFTHQKDDSRINNITIYLAGQAYNMGSQSEYIIDGLIRDTDYPIYYEYSVVDSITGKTFVNTTEEFVTRTAAKEYPQINKFELYRETSDSLTFKYDFTDDDGVVKNAYILVNNKDKVEYDGFSNSGRIKVENLSIGTIEYHFVFVIEYENGEQVELILSSEILKEVTVTPTPDPDPDPTPDPDPDPTPDPDPNPTPDPDPTPTPDPDPTPTPDPTTPKKKCGSKSLYLFEILSVFALIVVLLRKKHE